MHKMECLAMCAYGENWCPSETVRLVARIILKQVKLFFPGKNNFIQPWGLKKLTNSLVQIILFDMRDVFCFNKRDKSLNCAWFCRRWQQSKPPQRGSYCSKTLNPVSVWMKVGRYSRCVITIHSLCVVDEVVLIVFPAAACRPAKHWDMNPKLWVLWYHVLPSFF